jgi:hypothetical protein
MEISKITPGPKIGFTLHALLEEVLDDPTKNTEEYLENSAIELIKMPENELEALGEQGKMSKEEADDEEIKRIRSTHKVR